MTTATLTLAKRSASICAGAVLAAGALAGCGSDDGGSGDGDSDNASGGGDYCGTIEDVKSEFTAFEDADTTISDINDAGDRFDDIVDAAPDDIKSDWEAIATAFNDIAKALEDAGLDQDKPMQEALQADPKKAQEVQTDVMKALGDVEDPQKAVSKQVEKECDIEMGSGSSSQ